MRWWRESKNSLLLKRSKISQMTRRVAVTGIGAISAFGQTYPDLWAGLAAGKSAIRPLTLVAPGALRFPNAAEVPDYDPLRYFDEKEAQMLDRFAQFAAVAAREAVKTSGIEFSPELGERTAIVLGCSGGGKSTEDDGFHHLYATQGAPRFSTDHPTRDEQRRRQSRFVRIRNHRTRLHRFDRVFLRQSRHRTGVPDGPLGRSGSGHRRRQRSAVVLGIS